MYTFIVSAAKNVSYSIAIAVKDVFVSNTYLLTLLMVTPYPHRAPITPFVEPIAPFWIVMTCMTHRDVAGLLRPAIRYGPATGL